MKLKKSMKVVGAVAFSSVVAVTSIFSFGWINRPVEADGVVQPPYVTGSPESFDRTITRKLNKPLTTYVKEQHDAKKISDSEYNTLKNLPEIPEGAYRQQDGDITSLKSGDDLSEEDFANKAADLERNFDKYAAYNEKDGTEQDEKDDEDKDKDSESANTDDLRGTEEHPFVILEIKPDEDEGAMGYFMSSPEEGLPYDPMQLGKDLMETGKYSGSFYDYLNPRGGINSKDGSVNEGASTNLANEVGSYLGGPFANNMGVRYYKNTDNTYEPGTAEYYAKKNSELTTEVNIYVKKYYEVSTAEISDSDIATYKTVPKLLAANSSYKEIFKKDKDGKTIKSVALEDSNNWHIEKSTEPTKTETYNKNSSLVKNGYLYFAGKAKGDLCSKNYVDSNGNTDWSKICFEKSQYDNDQYNMWKIAATKSELPDSSSSKQIPTGKNWGNDVVNGCINGNFPVNSYIKLSDLVAGSYQIQFEYIKVGTYAYLFRYYNFAVRDTFMRRLFYKSEDSKYNDFHIQVISLTPEQINALDKYDTADTTSYIERADMFYIASFDDGDSDAYDMINFIKRYKQVVAGKATWNDFDKTKKVNWHDFNNNDLEWVDCARIIERLCLEKTTPLVYESSVANLLNKGVNQDGSTTNHVYLNKDYPDVEQIGSLNNMAKLDLVTVQFHLPKATLPGEANQSFLDLYMPKIRQIKLNKPAGTAQYTGWFERLDGKKCTCSASTEYKERSNYLWSKLTFVPDDSDMEAKIGSTEFDEILVNNYGFSSYYVSGGAVMREFSNKNWNGDFTKANGMRSGEIPKDGESTEGFDQTNVVFVWENNANANKNLFHNASEGINEIGSLGEFILKREGVDNSDLDLTIVKNKKEYVRVQNFAQPDSTKKYYEGEVMLDYSRDAKYSKDKTIYLKIGVSNKNAVRGKIKSIVFKNTTTGKNFDAIKKGLITSPASDDEKGTITWVNWSKSSGVYMTKAGANTILRLSLKRSEWLNAYGSTLDANGYPMRTKTADGYDQIEIKTQGRYRDSAGNIKEHPEKTYLIKITGRDLFPLE